MGEPQSTVASEAIAAGRPGVASSFRFHRPRGPLCGRGYCFQCEVPTHDGRTLACQTPAGPGGPRGRRRDFLRPLGRIAEAWPPWFYERRFLRTELVRRLSLGAIRRLSAAGHLGTNQACGAPGVRSFEEHGAATVVVGSPEHAPDCAHVVNLAQGDLALGVYPDRVLGVLREDSLVALHFDELVLATGTYERLPPIPGNDLPGVIGLRAAQRYAASGGLPRGTRIAVWTPSNRRSDVETLAHDYRLDIVWISGKAPRALSGRGHVERLHSEATVDCDLFVTAVPQPAIELALQADARAYLTSGELPILAVAETPEWLQLRAGAGTKSSGVPEVPEADSAFACLCEDVRVKDVRACVAQGFDHAELVKRRTGAMTGPCQGKLCSAAVLSVLREEGADATPTSARPLLRPVTLGDLASHA
jgi:bacterioferritin-associated ferredoxin